MLATSEIIAIDRAVALGRPTRADHRLGGGAPGAIHPARQVTPGGDGAIRINVRPGTGAVRGSVVCPERRGGEAVEAAPRHHGFASIYGVTTRSFLILSDAGCGRGGVFGDLPVSQQVHRTPEMHRAVPCRHSDRSGIEVGHPADRVVHLALKVGRRRCERGSTVIRFVTRYTPRTRLTGRSASSR